MLTANPFCVMIYSIFLSKVGFSGGYRGVAMVSAETPSERARAPNQRRLVSRRVGAVLEGELTAAKKR